MALSYDYHCTSCGKIFEERREVSARHNATCECGITAQQVIISPPTVLLESVSGDFPKATSRWANDRAHRLRLEAKHAEA